MQSARTEEGMKPVSEFIRERVDVDSRLCTEERHAAFCIIQIDAHFPRPVLQSHHGDRRCVGNILASSLQAYSPEAVGWADGELAFPVYGLSNDAQVPLDLFPNVHLPVEPSHVEALLGQHVGHAVKAFGVIRDLLELVSVPHLFSVIRDREKRVGCL